MTACARGRLALLLGLVLLAGCTDATTGPTDEPPGSGTPPSETDGSRSTPRPTPGPTEGIDAVLAGPWRRVPVDPRESEAIAIVEVTCRAAQPEIGPLPVALIDARGLGRLIYVFASNPTSAAWECRASVDARLAADVEVIKLQDAGEPIGDEDIDARHYESVALGDASGTVLAGRAGALVDEAIGQFNSDETFVYAAMGGGWWSMWWPGSEGINGVGATDTHNVVIGETRPELPLIP